MSDEKQPRENRTIRLTDIEHRKLKLVAKKDQRNISDQIIFMVERRLAEIRREQGE